MFEAATPLFLSERADEFRGRLDANAVAQRGEEMAAIVPDDDIDTGGSGDLGDVRVVDAAAGNAVGNRGTQQRQAVAGGKVVDGHPPRDLFFDEPQGVGRLQPEFGGQPRRH